MNIEIPKEFIFVISLDFLYLKPLNVWSRLKPTIYGDNRSFFLIHFLHILFGSLNNASTMYWTVGTSYVFITWDTCFGFNFDFNVALNLLKYSFLMFSFIPSGRISPFSKTPRYLYHSSPIWQISSPSSNSIPLHSTSFPFFIDKTPRLSIPNFIIMSFVTMSTVLTRLAVSFWLLLQSFRSFISDSTYSYPLEMNILVSFVLKLVLKWTVI